MPNFCIKGYIIFQCTLSGWPFISSLNLMNGETWIKNRIYCVQEREEGGTLFNRQRRHYIQWQGSRESVLSRHNRCHSVLHNRQRRGTTVSNKRGLSNKGRRKALCLTRGGCDIIVFNRNRRKAQSNKQRGYTVPNRQHWYCIK